MLDSITKEEFAALLAKDAKARQEALLLESFIIQAPAGSGKTELLTQRFLTLLCHVEHPEEVVALTFTNKAAAEMRSRILGSLVLAKSGDRPGADMPHKQLTFDLGKRVLDRDANLDWRILDHPGRLKITTIDALCSSLVRQMPFLSRFGAKPETTSDASPYYEAAALETLKLMETDHDGAATVAAAMAYFNNDVKKLTKLVVAMLGRRDQWQKHLSIGDHRAREHATEGLAHLISAELKELPKLIPPEVQFRLMAPARFCATQKKLDVDALADWENVLTSEPADLARWGALGRLLVDTSKNFRGTLTATQGFPASDPIAKKLGIDLREAIQELPDAACSALVNVSTLPSVDYEDNEWEIIEVLSQLLNLASGFLLLEFKEAGVIDFEGIAQSAIRALGSEDDPTDLALALDYRISHLLIDEFQDTSPKQIELVEGLTRGWQPDDGRTLFLVGDPMQSIYRFRKAEVSLFLRVAEFGIGQLALKQLYLYRNNRSDPAVVEWVNATFRHIFPSENILAKGAICYAPSATDKNLVTGAKVAVHPIIQWDDKESASDEEAAAILDIVDDTLRHNPAATIAVLVRAKAHLNPLLAALRRLRPELPYHAVDIETLDARQVVMDLLALTHAMFHRADRINWLAILRAPWCGLQLADLLVLAGDNHDSTIWQLMQDEERVEKLSEDGRRRLLHARGILEAALAQQGRLHPRLWVERTWRNLGGELCISSAREHEDVQAYFTMLTDLVTNAYLPLDRLQARVTALFAAPDVRENAGQIQLMSIHKSKGLEFDCVILPGLAKQPKLPESKLICWERAELHLTEERIIPATAEKQGKTSGKPTKYKFLGKIEREREGYELQRLLYVAATRAKHSLHLIGVLIPDGDAFEVPHNSSLLWLLWQTRVASEFIAQASAAQKLAVPSTKTGLYEKFVPLLVRLRTSAFPESVFPVTELRQSEHREKPSLTAGLEDTLSLDASVGTLVHRYLEIIANDGLQSWSLDRIFSLQKICSMHLQQAGHKEPAAKIGSQTVVQALVKTVGTEQGRWVLLAREDACSELALSRIEGNKDISNHIIDRTFVENGVRWIIDYKTVRCEEADEDAYLTNRAYEQYSEQLRRYASLFRHQNILVRMGIFYVLQGRFVGVKGDSESVEIEAA